MAAPVPRGGRGGFAGSVLCARPLPAYNFARVGRTSDRAVPRPPDRPRPCPWPAARARACYVGPLTPAGRVGPAPPVNRYEHAQPDDLLHLDNKKLGRFRRPGDRVTGIARTHPTGPEYVRLAVEDHSRIGFATIELDERGASARLCCPERCATAASWVFTRVMTDNATRQR